MAREVKEKKNRQGVIPGKRLVVQIAYLVFGEGEKGPSDAECLRWCNTKYTY